MATRCGHHRDERGSVSVQLTLLMPVLLLIVWVAMGAAVYHFGRTAALSAAQSGATAAAAKDGTLDACRAAAAELIGRLGDAITNATVTCDRSASEATATVTGTTLSLVPGWAPVVTQSAIVAREEVT